MIATLVNWSTGEVLEIECISWEVEKYQFYFYSDKEGKIVTCCISTRMWDIRKTDYDK